MEKGLSRESSKIRFAVKFVNYAFTMNLILAVLLEAAVALPTVKSSNPSIRALAVSAEAREQMERYSLKALENGDATNTVRGLVFTPKGGVAKADGVSSKPNVIVDGVAVTNFVNAFFAAYNARDKEALREMIVDENKYRHIVRGSERYGGALSMSIKSIDMDSLKAVTEISDKKRKSMTIVFEMESIGGVLRVRDSYSPSAKHRKEILDDALNVGRDFREAVCRSDTNAVVRLLGTKESDVSRSTFDQLLCDRNISWVASVMNGDASMSLKRVRVDGEKIFVVFETAKNGGPDVKSTKYIGYQDEHLTVGVETHLSGKTN